MKISITKAIGVMMMVFPLLSTLNNWDRNPEAAWWSGLLVVALVIIFVMLDEMSHVTRTLKDHVQTMDDLMQYTMSLKLEMLKMKKEGEHVLGKDAGIHNCKHG